MSQLFILSAKRTPFGSFGGKLKGFTATDLAVHASKAALSDVKGLEPSQVGSSVWGNVAQTSVDAAYMARHVGLRSGLKIGSTALTVNRLCGSGFQALVSAAHELGAGENESRREDLVIVAVMMMAMMMMVVMMMIQIEVEAAKTLYCLQV